MLHLTYKNYSVFPLTGPQRDIWNYLQSSGDFSLYNLGVYVSIKGPMDFDIFQTTINRAIQKFDTLRIRLVTIDNDVYQYFLPTLQNVVQQLDFSDTYHSFDQILQWMQEDCVKLFSLFHSDLFKYTLIRCGSNHFVWYIKLHHIIIDGWGNSLLFDEIFQTYNRLCHKETVVSEPSYSYKTFIHSEIDYNNSSTFQEDILYWKKKFATIPKPIKSYNSYFHHHLQKPPIKYASFQIHREVYDSIIYALKKYGLSGFNYALAITSLLFCTRKNRHEMIIGALVLNREKEVFKKIAGLFYNELPIRITLFKNQTVLALLKSIQREIRENYIHQRITKGQIHSLALGRKCFPRSLIEVSLSYTIFNHDQQFQDFETETVVFHQNQNLNNLFIFVDASSKNKDILISFEDQNNIIENHHEFNAFVRHFQNVFISLWKSLELPIDEWVSP